MRSLMRSLTGLTAVALLCGSTFATGPEVSAEHAIAPPPVEPVRPRIEVAFVLDTTGSMGGLIEGAKQKIWSITNDLLAAQPTPDIRLALVPYRDRDDAYVTQVFDLTDDLDAVYGNLMGFAAHGGGDGPESVNAALHDAVHKLAWSEDRGVLKIIFLVGDAPPHMDYQDDVKYQETCEAAVLKDLIINTIQCGSSSDTTTIWTEIASLSEGSFVQISQTGDMRTVATPMDERLGELNRELNATLLPYGGAAQQAQVRDYAERSEAAPMAAAADRLSVMSRQAEGKAVSGRGDLVADLAAGEVDADYLNEAPAQELPEAMRTMTREQRLAYIEQRQQQREQLQTQIRELSSERRAFLDKQQRDQVGGARDSFDQQVARVVREQAARKGIDYAEPTPDAPDAPQPERDATP